MGMGCTHEGNDVFSPRFPIVCLLVEIENNTYLAFHYSLFLFFNSTLINISLFKVNIFIYLYIFF